MKKTFFIIGGIILILLANASLLYFGLVGLFWYSISNMYIVQPLAQNVQVTSEWKEIEINPSLNIKKQVQKISLKIDDYESKTNDNSFQIIKLKDGTILNPEIILIDENNKKYRLKDCCRTYSGSTTNSAEFGFDQKSNGLDSLPKDVKYKAVFIKSDKPFKCDITWIDNDLK